MFALVVGEFVGQYRQMFAMKYLLLVFRIGMSVIQLLEGNNVRFESTGLKNRKS